ncbi:hypothetical protein [Paucibacter soli]|uniref:hypothetical protein n=1 Tax=Paucibacter soli TaxID=3133433 RepID=UPI0030B71FFF
MAICKGMRRWLSGALTVALLFMQLATAAYACPQLEPSMPDCHAMGGTSDPEQPQLCKAHCTQDAQASAAQALPVLQVNSDSLCLVQPLPAPVDVGTLLRPVSASAPTHPGDPPLYLALLILRN